MSETIRLQLRVSPGSGRAAVIGRYGAAWKLCVTSPPEKGRANRDVVALLAEALELPRTSVEIVSGHRGRDKVVALTSAPSLGAVERALETAAVLAGAPAA